MARQTGWGWKKIVLSVIGVAAAMVLLLVTMAAAGLVWATSAAERLGEPVPEPVARTVATRDAAAAVAAAGDPERPLRVEIVLEEGEFEVRPGPPGSGVRVDGTYAKAYYDLTEEHTPAGEPGGPATVIRLRPAHSFIVRLIGNVLGGHDRAHNALTVTIPKGVPIALTLALRTGETRTDLGGLTLTELDADLAMGEHRVDFSEPLAGRPHRMRVDGSMGEVRFERIGNAGPRELEASGRMGSLVLDLGGDWPRDAVADLTLDNSMGELRLDVPDAVRIASDADVANRFGATGGIPTVDEAGGETPLLRLHVTNSMGETRVRRY
jgi:hypothetical protein